MGLTGASSTSAAALALVATRRADSVVDSYGVCVPLNHQETVYGRHDQVISWLNRLGVRHIRSRVALLRDVVDAMRDLAYDHGIKVDGSIGTRSETYPLGPVMAGLKRAFPNPAQVFSGFESINEPNNEGVPWIATTRRRTMELHQARNAAGLNAIPIIAPALARVNSGGAEGGSTEGQAARLGSLSRYVDVANMHVYPRALPPSTDIARFRACARRVHASGPIVCTEGGYFNAMRFRDGGRPTPEPVSACYAPQQILEHVLAGTQRFFRYELLDMPNASMTDRDHTFGAIRTGAVWRPKMDFEPIRLLLAAMADPGPAFTPRPIEMSVTGAPPDFRSLAFAKRNGTHVLAMWLNRPIYDPARQRVLVPSLTAPQASIRLTLGAARTVQVRHLAPPGRVSARGATRQETIGLPPGVTLVTIG